MNSRSFVHLTNEHATHIPHLDGRRVDSRCPPGRRQASSQAHNTRKKAATRNFGGSLSARVFVAATGRLGTYFLTIKKDTRKAEKDGIARRGAYCWTAKGASFERSDGARC